MGRSFRHSKNWGGERSGAGRKSPDPTVKVSVTLPESVLRQVEALTFKTGESRSEAISRLLVAALRKH